MTANRYVRMAVLGLLALAPINAGQAMEIAPIVFDGPVPADWREPFSRFLVELGVTDVEGALNATKTRPLDGLNATQRERLYGSDNSPMALRVQALGFCSAVENITAMDSCVTIIGRLVQGVFISDAIFSAGGEMNSKDTETNFFGTRSYMVRFFAKNTVVGIVNSAKGIIVSSAPRTDAPNTPRTDVQQTPHPAAELPPQDQTWRLMISPQAPSPSPRHRTTRRTASP
jgi:hypothetical protein